MPIKELSVTDQIKILEKLDNEQNRYDKNMALAKHDLYALKHKFSVNTEPSPLTAIQSTINQRPTTEAIQNLQKSIREIVSKKKQPVSKPQSISPSPSPYIAPKLEFESPVKPEDEIEDDTVLLQDDNDEQDIETVIRSHKFPTIDQIKEEDIEEVVESLKSYNKNVLGARLATLTRAGHKDSEDYSKLKRDVEILRNFRKELESKQVGQGLNKTLPKKLGRFGRFYIRKDDLHNGWLRVRRKNQTKVMDVQLSEGVRNLILKRYEPKKYKYSEEDYRKFKEICDQTGYRPKIYSKLHTYLGGSFFVTLKEAQQRLLNCLGEIKAGNTNVEVKNELVSIADLLLKHDKITKEEYKAIVTF
jgi:hypothetical protein